MDNSAYQTSIFSLLLILLIQGCTGIKYFMDSTLDCRINTVINLNYQRKITLEGRQSLLAASAPGTCSFTFSSEGGFMLDFDKGYIYGDGVKLTIYLGQDNTAPIWKTYTKGSYFERSDTYVSSKYLTVELIRTSRTANYDFELEIEGRYSNTWTNSSVHLGRLSSGIIAAIVISSIVCLLCCILVPLGIFCCLKKRRRHHEEVPVVYSSAPPPAYYNQPQPPPTYGQPSYLHK